MDKKFSSLKKIISTSPEIIAVYLFGSYLETPDQARDIDLAILTSDAVNSVNMYLDLYQQFTEIFSPLEVDLLFLKNSSLLLSFEIISKGKVIYSADDDIRTDYEYLISGKYMDFKYHLEMGQKELYETVKEGVVFV